MNIKFGCKVERMELERGLKGELEGEIEWELEKVLKREAGKGAPGKN